VVFSSIKIFKSTNNSRSKTFRRNFIKCKYKVWKTEGNQTLVNNLNTKWLYTGNTQIARNKRDISIKKNKLLRRGAGKSLVRPGRKQATATKLEIYSTYSPRSSIHFLARCSNVCKPLKKNSEGCPSNQVSAAAMTSASEEKWQPFNCFFFQTREQVVVRRGQIRRIGWVIITLEAQVGQFLLGCKRPVSRGIVVQEQDPLRELPAAFFLQNVLQLHQQRWVILRADSLAL